MNQIVNRLRSVIFVAAALAVPAIALFLGIQPQKAQDRPVSGELPVKYSKADEATRDIRSGNKDLYRVRLVAPGDLQKAPKLGRIVGEAGPFVVIAAENFGAVKRSGMDAVRLETDISLSSGKFDPINVPPDGTVTPGDRVAGHGDGYYVVQFGSMVTDDLLDSLKSIGVEVLQYVPHQAYFVYGSGEAIAKAAAHSRVRWVGAYLPGQKMSAVVSEQIEAARNGRRPADGISPLRVASSGTTTFNVAVFKRVDLDQAAAMIVNTYGGIVVNKIELPGNYFNVVRVELSLDEAERVLDIPGVITIDPWQKPEREDERAAQIVAGNYTSTTLLAAPGYNPFSQFGADGSNVTVSMVDDGVSIPGNGGFYITSTNTKDADLRGSTSGASGGHGHLNASIISGASPFGALDPTGYNYGLGIAPGSNILNIPALKSGYTGSEAESYSDSVTTTGPNGVVGTISNNSWGNLTNSNVYDSYTSQFDGFVRDATVGGNFDPICLVFSAGNSGPGALSLTRPKAAKNLIATGNSENIRTEFSGTGADNIDDLRGSSSRGPAADGRVKPDITAPGTYITGSRAGDCSSVTSCFDANHAYSIGTSHAAPQIAGAAALFTEWWKNTHSGVTPSPSLIKAAIINTAVDMNGANTTGSAPNGNEGWGRVNMRFMLNPGVAVKHIDESVPLNSPGDSMTITGSIVSDQKLFRVSLVWTDPPGAANANPALVNNLDLTVTVGANTYKGNVFSGGLSTTGGSADTINNVENVWLPSGLAQGTPVTIIVTATALNGDGILGNADITDQHFSLVVYNFSETAVNLHSRADFDGDGKTDNSVYRPSEGNWYLNRSTLGFGVLTWGTATDVLLPGDYDGDGKADTAIYRANPDSSVPDYYILNSNGFTLSGVSWGTTGDLPVSGDYDGDGKTDYAIFRPSTGFWYILNSSDGSNTIENFGLATDVPLAIDNDGDGKTNLAVFRPSNNSWYIARPAGSPATNFDTIPWGAAGDKLAVADYDGDNKDDIAVWRPSTGVWYILRSSNGQPNILAWGTNGDVPVPGDYDGDGKDDIAIYRPSNGQWWMLRSSAGVATQTFGLATDKPIPAAYLP